MRFLSKQMTTTLSLLAAVCLLSVGCADAMNNNDDAREAESQAGAADGDLDDLGGGGGRKADSFESCDCGLQQVCVFGSCADVKTWTVDKKSHDGDGTTAVRLNGSSVNVAHQHTNILSQGPRGYKVSLYTAESAQSSMDQQSNYFDQEADRAPIVQQPRFVDDEASQRPTLTYARKTSVEFLERKNRELKGFDKSKIRPVDGNRVYSYDVQQTSQGMVLAVSQSADAGEDGTWIWEERTERMLPLGMKGVNEIEIVEVAGRIELIVRNGPLLYRATRVARGWKTEEVADLTGDSRASSFQWTIDAVGHDDHVHLVTYRRAHDRGSFQTVARHLRLEGSEIAQRQTLGTGEFRKENDQFQGGRGLRAIAPDIAIDGAGNAYILTLEVVSADDRRRARLVKIDSRGNSEAIDVAKWPGSDHEEPFSYALDVSDEGNILVAGYEEATTDLKIRLFEGAGR